MRIQNESSFAYVLRNFFFLLPLCILPSVLLSYASSSVLSLGPIEFLVNMLRSIAGGEYVIDNFYEDVLSYIILINLSSRWWIWLLGLLTGFIALCCVFSAVERHMRLGVRKYSRIFAMLNDSFVPVLSYCVGFLLIYELLAFITSGIILLCYAMGITSWALFVLSCVFIALMCIAATLVGALTICTVPACVMEGYRLNIAASYSAQIISKHASKVIGAIWAYFLSGVLFMGASKIFLNIFPNHYSPNIHMAIAILMYLLYIMAIPAFSVKTYIKYTDAERKDLKTKLFN